MSNTRIITCALAAAVVLFIGSEAITQGNRPVTDVTVTNTPLSVTVTNPTIPPSTVNVGNPAALAAANAQVLRVTPVAFQVSTGGRSSYSVPLGQRLVMEYATGYCNPPGTAPVPAPPQIFFTINGFLQQVFFPAFSLPNPPWTFAQTIKAYADPGTNVTTQPLS
jgi:hypothetical protein